MSICVIGFNHKTASVNVRERVYFALDKLSLYLQDLLGHHIAHEAVLLSTCNRSELYCDTNDVFALRDWFCAQGQVPRAELESSLYIYQNAEAVAHIMQVACGLDSMIIGEPQILGQMKEAFSESCTAGAIDTLFHRLFQMIFSMAKEIRTTTAIGACPVSVASASVNFARQHLPDFEKAQVVLIGAGDTSALLLRYLKDQLKRPVILINRSFEKAVSMVEPFGGIAADFTQLPKMLAQADLLFSATGSATPILTPALVQTAMQARLGKPQMLIDVAVPRDIDADVATLAGVTLYCIDDLKVIIEKNRQGREHAADKIREMIREKSDEFIAELASFDKVAHTIRVYRGQIEALCHAELLKARQQLHQGRDSHQVLEQFANAFINKLLHQPSIQLRQAGAEGRFDLLQLAKQLFAISDHETEKP
jgi:glutamyl-tRNA reductase